MCRCTRSSSTPSSSSDPSRPSPAWSTPSCRRGAGCCAGRSSCSPWSPRSTAFLATRSGEDLLESRPELEPLVEEHEERGELLRNVALGFVLVSVLGAWALGGASALASGKGARETRLGRSPVVALLAVGSVALLVTVFLAGDSGARAVWG